MRLGERRKCDFISFLDLGLVAVSQLFQFPPQASRLFALPNMAIGVFIMMAWGTPRRATRTGRTARTRWAVGIATATASTGKASASRRARRRTSREAPGWPVWGTTIAVGGFPVLIIIITIIARSRGPYDDATRQSVPCETWGRLATNQTCVGHTQNGSACWSDNVSRRKGPMARKAGNE